MRRFTLLTLLIFFSTTLVLAVKVGLYVSNTRVNVFISSPSLEAHIGYPWSSLKIGKESYLSFAFQESTPLFILSGGLNVWKNENFFLTFGASVEFGTLQNAFDNSKLKEMGRGYVRAEMGFTGTHEHIKMSYSRFITSMERAVVNDAFFFFPPNYNGESPNNFKLSLSYLWSLSKNVKSELFFTFGIKLSDAGIFSDPSFEMGFSLSTPFENLKKSF